MKVMDDEPTSIVELRSQHSYRNDVNEPDDSDDECVRIAARQSLKDLTVIDNNVNLCNIDESVQNLLEVTTLSIDAGWIEPMTSLCFRNLSYARKGEILLDSASGFVKPHMMVAVVGGADSIASTLLLLLAGRHHGGDIQGEILVNSSPPDEDIKRIVGYVPKGDIHIATQTVREAVMFSARIRRLRQIPDAILALHVDLVLRILGLNRCAHTIIGDENVRGISGGERRRLSIAIAAVAGHSLMLLDSPTNGLDSISALNLVASTRALTRAGSSFIMSLHQPSMSMLKQFDVLCVMGSQTCMYWGPVQDAVPFFESLGYERPMKKDEGDFLSEIMADPSKFRKAEVPSSASRFVSSFADNYPLKGGTIDELAISYRNSTFHDEVGVTLWRDPDFQLQNRKPRSHVWDTSCKYNTSACFQFWLILCRDYKLLWRNWRSALAQAFRSFVMALLVGTIYSDLRFSQADIQSRFGVFYFCLAYFGFSAMLELPIFFNARHTFYAQKNLGFFRNSSYFFSSLICRLPILFVEVFGFCVILYTLTGLHGGVFNSEFVYFFAATMQVLLIGRAYATGLVCVLPSETVAQVFGTFVIGMSLVTAGFLIPYSDLPVWWKWSYTTSFVARPFAGLAINEFTAMGEKYFDCPGQRCLHRTPADVLSFYSWSDDNGVPLPKWQIWINNWIFFFIMELFAFIAISSIHFQSHEIAVKRKKTMADTVSNIASSKRSSTSIINSKRTKLTAPQSHTSNTAGASTQARMTFWNLSYEIELSNDNDSVVSCGSKTPKLSILKNTFGYAEKGHLVALLGPSGAGKSTLLDILAGRKTIGTITGSLLLNGKVPSRFHTRQVGYVEQTDSLVCTDTVREAIAFSARLRLSSSLSDRDRRDKVDAVLHQLRLEHVQDSIIGSVDNGGLSSMTRKKVSIGIELVAEPSILFMDEPTTGVDSLSAQMIVETARQLAIDRSVVVTIHQPSAELFELFDWLLMLKRGGEVVYFGEKNEFQKYCDNNDIERPDAICCEDETNLADYALSALCSDTSTRDMAALFRHSQMAANAFEHINHVERTHEKIRVKKHETSNTCESHTSSQFATSSALQFWTLLKREFRAILRDRSTTAIRVFAPFIQAALLASLFWQLNESPSQMLNRITLVFMIVVVLGFTQQCLIALLPLRRPLYYREISSSMYHVLPEYAAAILAQSTLVFLQAVPAAIIVYIFSGLRADTSAFINFVLVVWLFTETCASFCQLLASIITNTEILMLAFVTFFALFMLFTGYLAPISTLPPIWKPIAYISFFRNAFFFLAANELQCVPQSLAHSSDDNALMATTQVGANCMGEQLLDTFGIQPEDKALYLSGLFCFLVMFRVMGYFMQRFIKHIDR